jgi:hypothetical protein
MKQISGTVSRRGINSGLTAVARGFGDALRVTERVRPLRDPSGMNPLTTGVLFAWIGQSFQSRLKVTVRGSPQYTPL